MEILRRIMKIGPGEVINEKQFEGIRKERRKFARYHKITKVKEVNDVVIMEDERKKRAQGNRSLLDSIEWIQ
jgi:hypothetical protein